MKTRHISRSRKLAEMLLSHEEIWQEKENVYSSSSGQADKNRPDIILKSEISGITKKNIWLAWDIFKAQRNAALTIILVILLPSIIKAAQIPNPEIFGNDTVFAIFDYFMGIGLALFVPVLIICLAAMLTQRS